RRLQAVALVRPDIARKPRCSVRCRQGDRCFVAPAPRRHVDARRKRWRASPPVARNGDRASRVAPPYRRTELVLTAEPKQVQPGACAHLAQRKRKRRTRGNGRETAEQNCAAPHFIRL